MTEKAPLWIEGSGWLGALLILGAYFLVSTRRVEGQAASYQWMNLVGGVGLAVSSFAHRAYPVFVVNATWAVIAAFTLLRAGSRPAEDAPEGS